MYEIIVETENRNFELLEDDKDTFLLLETFKTAKRERKGASFSFFCRTLMRQVVIGIEQIQFITYKPSEEKEDKN